MPEQIRLLKVFVSCTGDVEEEKNQVRQACNVLGTVSRDPKIRIEVIDWKGNVSPQITGENPQKRINEQIKDYDIYVGIFWKYFGIKQENKMTPTEEEFNLALDSFKKNGKPLILMYFKIDEFYPKTSLEAEQMWHVTNFKERIKPLGLFREFKAKDYFFQLVMKDIADQINNNEWLRT
jgi:hypothetical protein